MEENLKKDFSEDLIEINRRYLDIIHCMPNVVYWIDLDCKLKGFNQNFFKLLDINNRPNFTNNVELSNSSIVLDIHESSPYKLLNKYAFWPKDRLFEMELDDMGVIFSGNPMYNIAEPPINLGPDKDLHYLSTRVPLLDKYKKINGLLVILVDVDDYKTNTQEKHKDTQKNLTKVVRGRDKHIKILMVEDNLVAQKVEENVMTNLGCAVDIASSGEEALALFELNQYDLIFMDIGLQDTSGYIVAKKIREKEQGSSKNVPIIAITSYKAEVVKYDCHEYFMEGVITKPLTKEQAEQIIQSFVYNQDVIVDGMIST